MNFAVLHIKKYKELKGIGYHIDRTHIASNVNESKTYFNEEFASTEGNSVTLNEILGSNIDTKKTFKNTDLISCSKNLLDIDINNRIKQGYKRPEKIRKDAIKAVGIILSGSHERMKEIEKDEKLFEEWKKTNFEFVKNKYGAENIVRMTLHLDEKTPHFHCVFVPITPDGRLSAKNFFDERDGQKLTNLQNEYAKAMEPFGLNRGISKTVTNRKHYTTKDFYLKNNAAEKELDSDLLALSKGDTTKIKKIKDTVKEFVIQKKLNEIKYKKHYNNSSNEIYQNNYKLDYASIYDSIKKNPIVPFAINKLQYTIDKKKSSKQWTVLKHETQEKIIVNNKSNPKTGHYLFQYATNTNKGGTIIDLLKNHGWNNNDILQLHGISHNYKNYQDNISEINISKEDDTIKDINLQERLAKEKFNKILHNTEDETYLNQRYISKQIIDYYANSCLKTNTQEAIFKQHCDFNIHLESRQCSTLIYIHNKTENFKKNQWKLPKGFCVLRPQSIDSVTNIVITESPIDALSYAEIFLKDIQNENNIHNTMLISTCGTLSNKQNEDLQNIIQSNYPITIATDNDSTGAIIAKDIEKTIKKTNNKYEFRIPKKSKDWNDCLKYKKTKNSIYLQNKNISIENKLQKSLYTKNEVILNTKLKIKYLETINDIVSIEQNNIYFKLQNSDYRFKHYNNILQVKQDEKGIAMSLHNSNYSSLLIINDQVSPEQVIISSNPFTILSYRQAILDKGKSDKKIMYISTNGSTNKTTIEDLGIRLKELEKQGSEVIITKIKNQKINSDNLFYEIKKQNIKHTNIQVDINIKLVAEDIKAIFSLSKSNSFEKDIEENDKRNKKGLKVIKDN